MPEPRPPRLFFWPLDEAGLPLGDPRKLSKFLSDDPSRIGWFPDGSFAALRQREVA